MVVYYCRYSPFLLTDKGTAQIPIQLDARLLDAARRLGALADFLAIPCNSVHLLLGEIEQAAGCKVISMIEATLEEVRRRRWHRVGILGFGDPLVYTRPLQDLGITCETINADARTELDAAIFRLMEGRDDASSVSLARAAVADLRNRSVDGIILGCTEIPLLLREFGDAVDLINPTQMLAEAAVQEALG